MRARQSISWLVAPLVVMALVAGTTGTVAAAGAATPTDTVSGEGIAPADESWLCQAMFSPVWPYYVSEDLERLLEIAHPFACGSIHSPLSA